MKTNILRILRLFVVGFLKSLLLLLFIFTSCTEKEAPLYVNLDANTLTFEYEGGSQTITLSSNGGWTVS